jgi:hypothetical protein
MDNIKFNYIGWCNEENHDKIWASFSINDSHYAMWGARGKSVSFKKHDSIWDLNEVTRKKQKKYWTVNESKITEIWPDFYEQLNKRLFYCILANKIK